MKKRFLLTLGVFYSLQAFSQQTPTPAVPADPTSSLPNTQKGAYAWYRGGNSNAFNPAGSSNIFGTLWNSPIYTQTNGVTRMVLQGGGTGNNDGRMALGNNLVGAFTPANRLHLHQTGGDFGIQFTNNTTGNSASNGFVMDLLDNGRFQFSQYQNQDVRFQMPNSLLMQLIG